MKKLGFSYLVLLSFVGMAAAADVALVYDNDAAVLAGQASFSPMTAEGILVSAKWALANNASMRVGVPGDKLKKSTLLRLDAKSDAALIQPGDVIEDPALQAAFQNKAQVYGAFLGSAGVAAGGSETSIPVSVVSTEPYKIILNGQDVGITPIPLKVRFRKSALSFEIVRTSTSPVWYFDMKLTAQPKLSFWKTGKNQSLTDIPTPEFTYGQQVFFRPLASGRSVKVSVEAYYMEEGAYTLNLTMKSKEEVFEKKIPVIFKSK